jgi:hypothetical protein
MSPPHATRVSPAALAAFLLGLASLGLLALAGVPAALLGLRGLRAVNAAEGRLRGRRLAIAALALGGLTTLLTVLGIAALVILHLRALSARTESANNLRQIGQAVNRRHDLRGAFPAATLSAPGVPADQRLSWLAGSLPYLGEKPRISKAYQDLFAQLDPSRPWDDQANRAGRAPLRVFLCSAHPDYDPYLPPGKTHYVGICGIGPGAIDLPREHPRAGVFGHVRGIARREVKAGISFTLMAAETTRDNGPWIAGGYPTARGLAPDEVDYFGRDRPFGGIHAGGLYVLYVDGSARWLSDDLPAELFWAQATLAGKRVEREE